MTDHPKPIARYFPNRNYAFMEDHPNGAYVQFHDHEAAIAAKDARIAELERLLWTPENEDFIAGVMREAGHQVERWGSEHDAGKEPPDWFWLIGYLAGKALRAAIDGDDAKAKHHCISTAAVCANWHAHIAGAERTFRPGLGPDRHETKIASPEEHKP